MNTEQISSFHPYIHNNLSFIHLILNIILINASAILKHAFLLKKLF